MLKICSKVPASSSGDAAPITVRLLEGILFIIYPVLSCALQGYFSKRLKESRCGDFAHTAAAAALAIADRYRLLLGIRIDDVDAVTKAIAISTSAPGVRTDLQPYTPLRIQIHSCAQRCAMSNTYCCSAHGENSSPQLLGDKCSSAHTTVLCVCKHISAHWQGYTSLSKQCEHFVTLHTDAIIS
jgi:hypothetical protein